MVLGRGSAVKTFSYMETSVSLSKLMILYVGVASSHDYRGKMPLPQTAD